MSTATDEPKVRIPDGKLFINGEFVDASDSSTFDTINPATGEVITTIASATEDDVNKAVSAARAAFDGGEWSKWSARKRGRLLFKVAQYLRDNIEEFAALETMDNGKPIFESLYVDMPKVAETLEYYGGWADKIGGSVIPVDGNAFSYTLKEPVGVVAAITPWNFPLMIAAWKIAPALAVGCTVILKPASYTTLTALKLAEAFKACGAPEGVFNVVTGSGSTVGGGLVRHPDVDKIAFTGSTSVGQWIAKEAAGTVKKVTLELGGKSPNIVLADADIDAAVRGAVNGIFYGKGEVCAAGSRLFVDATIHDEFMEKLVGRTERMQPADPMHPKTRMGAIVSEDQMNTVLEYIEKGKTEGANLVAGGERATVDGKGFYVQPTVFDQVTPDMTIAREEIFGPVLSTLTFSDDDEAVAMGNDSIYGLAAAVWTSDVKKAHRIARALRAGTVWVNAYNMYDVAQPFGGYKQSGYGRDMGAAALDGYLQTKSVYVDLN